MAEPNTLNFEDWLNELEKTETPEACSIDDPTCDSCGS